MLLSDNLVAEPFDVLVNGECCSCGHRVSWYMCGKDKVYSASCNNCNLGFFYNENTQLVRVYDSDGRKSKFL